MAHRQAGEGGARWVPAETLVPIATAAMAHAGSALDEANSVRRLVDAHFAKHGSHKVTAR